MLDTNCLLHPCVADILTQYKNNQLELNNMDDLRTQLELHIWNKIKLTIDGMIDKLKPEYIFVAIDGVAPMGKILQQRQRRYKFLFDKKIKLDIGIDVDNNSNSNFMDVCVGNIKPSGIEEPTIPLSSIELTPGTDYMERIHNKMNEYMSELGTRSIKYIYSSYHDEGEGEHKIIQYIRNNIKSNANIVIYGLDADLLFLSMGLSLGLGLESSLNLYVMREKQIFSNEPINLNEAQEYNYVDCNQLNNLVSELDISTNDFIGICYLIGNDFLPNLLTLDIKKKGLDKILKAWNFMKKKNNIITEYDQLNKIKSILVNQNNLTNEYTINMNILKKLFEELTWTERYVWEKINRDPILNESRLNELKMKNSIINKSNNLGTKNFKTTSQDDRMEQMEKFLSGESSKINFLDRIEFNSPTEYYNYYLGINSISIDSKIISKMVNDYIGGLNWSINYYLNDCVSWTWGYNFLVAPLICDIVKLFPNDLITNNLNNQVTNKLELKKITRTIRTLRPVEQLALAIPPQTWKYVLEPNIINELRGNLRIGYMFPESYNLDVNKEDIYWKCQVIIPIVEPNEYINQMKKINISNEKNQIYGFIKNF